MFFLRITFILLLFIGSLNHSYAQKVGLVLSGGGAKGLAHIGVIKALEEQNIPIDYVAGTSIGAIVGGLYAAGYSPDEMYELFRSEKFKLWSTGEIEEERVYYFKKDHPNASMLKLDWKESGDTYKLKLPTNIIPEAQMDFAFMELFAGINAACDYDFDNLFVPFRCVSTDVYKNEQVVSHYGDLGEAIRASMTFPLYFKPIEIDGSLLFDGGIVNNFPTDVMEKDFKPDFIIGHKVAADLKKPDPDDLVAQLENIVMRPTNYQIPDSLGILLETRFEDVDLLDFDRLPFIFEKGYKTATDSLEQIKAKIGRRVTAEDLAEKREAFKARMPQLMFNNIQVEGVKDNMQRKYIIQSIKKKSPVVRLSEFKDAYFKLVADQQIKSIRPIAYYNKETNFFDLHLKVESDKDWEVEIGGNVSSKAINQGFVGVRYKFFNNQAYNLHSNIYFGRFYSSFEAGGRIDFPSTKPFYISGNITFNRWDFFRSSSELFFEDVHPAYIIKSENSARFNFGFPLGVNRKVEFGLSSFSMHDSYYQAESFKKEDTPDITKFYGYALTGKLERNTLNAKQYATEGTMKLLKLKYIGATERTHPGSTAVNNNSTRDTQGFFEFQIKYNRYFKLNSRFTFGLEMESVLNTKDLLANYTASILSAPGFTPTPHSKSVFLDNFHANNFAAGGGKLIFNFNEKLHLRTEGYYFMPLKKIKKLSNQLAQNDNFKWDNTHLMGNVSLVYRSFLGPASVSVNYYDKPGDRWYFLFNFGYILFNKKGF
ncbi:patatin [Prolixibacteraceae bacterium JC049]|nr:patatin [Prolixibacteraceae bacterium JC049]